MTLRPRRKGSLVLRLFVLGVVQLALIVIVGDWLIRSRVPLPDPSVNGIVAGFAADAIAPVANDRDRVTAVLADLKARHRVEISVYADPETGERQLVASNVAPPVPSERLRPSRAMFVEHARFEQDGQRYLLVSRVLRVRSSLSPPWIIFLAGLAIVGLGAVGLARWVLRPLQDLSRAAKALGDGDLGARSGLTRKDELGQLGQTFDHMAGRIQSLLLAEKELLANVSHELRTPLARIRVALDLAAEGDANAARASLAEIGIDLAELESLIDDILTTTRFEVATSGASGPKLPLHLEATSARDVVERSAERFRTRHPERSLAIAVDGDVGAMHADAVLLRRVFDNLLENAHKYSPDAKAPIDFSAARQNGTILFEVRDHGIGIPTEDLPHVFTPFFRGERSRSRGAGGVGLGLTLAKRIAEAHGGSISVTSAKAGTTFRVQVPAATD